MVSIIIYIFLFLLIETVVIGISLLAFYFIYLKLTVKNKSHKELLQLTVKNKKIIILIPVISLIIFFILFYLSFNQKVEYLGEKVGFHSELDKLVRGKIAYNISDTMKVGTQYLGIVSISKAINDSILFLGLDSSNFITDEIKVSSKVEVSLIDPTDNKNFEITSLNTQEQLVDVTTNTIWEWNIIPLRSGTNYLIIRATVRIITDLGVTPKDIPVYRKIITVQASPFFSIGQFIHKNWQWLLGTLLIPLLVWLYQKKKKKGNELTSRRIGFRQNS